MSGLANTTAKQNLTVVRLRRVRLVGCHGCLTEDELIGLLGRFWALSFEEMRVHVTAGMIPLKALPRRDSHMGHRTRIMYIESKTAGLNGPARIGRVTYSKTGRTIYYRGKEFVSVRGFKVNYVDVNSHEEYWISGPRRDGEDRLYVSNLPVEIDEDVREEYWTDIRKRPDLKHLKNSN